MGIAQHKVAVERIRFSTDKGFIAPEYLHGLIAPCDTKVITFRNESAMMSYRHMIYTINKQGTYRYRTMRDEDSMFGLVIWRMR